MIAYQKHKAARAPAYLRFVRELPCVVCSMPAGHAHHLIDEGAHKGMGLKVSDYYTLPICPMDHDVLHRDPQAWIQRNGSQWMHVAKTLERAALEGVI